MYKDLVFNTSITLSRIWVKCTRTTVWYDGKRTFIYSKLGCCDSLKEIETLYQGFGLFIHKHVEVCSVQFMNEKLSGTQFVPGKGKRFSWERILAHMQCLSWCGQTSWPQNQTASTTQKTNTNWVK